MLEEEEDVDIETFSDDGALRPSEVPRLNGECDEDALWALDDPDDDNKGWNMKVLILDEDAI